MSDLKLIHYLPMRIACLICFSLLFSNVATAQRSGSAARGGSVRPDRVQTEKPTGSRAGGLSPAATPSPSPTPGECDPDTVVGTCPGTYSFTYGFNANASPRSGGAQTEKAGFAFAVYLTRRIFLELDNDNVVSSKASPDPRVTGFGDTTLYVGADALLEAKGRPGITVLYGIKAPTASSRKGLGSGEVDHTLLAAFSKTLGRENRTYLEFDIGDYIAGETNSSGFNHFPFAAGIVRRKLDRKKKYTLHFEIGGDFATKNSDADLYNLDYLETKLSDHVSLRTGGRFGLTTNVSRAGLYLALKFSGNLKEIFK